MSELAGIPNHVAFLLGSLLSGLGIGIFLMGVYMMLLSLGFFTK